MKMGKSHSLTFDLRKEEILTFKAFYAVLFFGLLISACAQIRVPIPFTPVPLTLQILAVFLCGYFLTSKVSSLSMTFYLLFGFLGVPVFSGWGSGLASLIGPTGGFIVGFLPAVWAVSYVSQKRMLGRFNFAVTTLVGLSIVYFFGLINLLFYVYFAMQIRGWELFLTAFQLGVVPFVLADLAKAAVAASIFYGLFRGRKLV
jgi:biotin transport system substrate-specific component